MKVAKIDILGFLLALCSFGHSKVPITSTPGPAPDYHPGPAPDCHPEKPWYLKADEERVYEALHEKPFQVWRQENDAEWEFEITLNPFEEELKHPLIDSSGKTRELEIFGILSTDMHELAREIELRDSLPNLVLKPFGHEIRLRISSYSGGRYFSNFDAAVVKEPSQSGRGSFSGHGTLHLSFIDYKEWPLNHVSTHTVNLPPVVETIHRGEAHIQLERKFRWTNTLVYEIESIEGKEGKVAMDSAGPILKLSLHDRPTILMREFYYDHSSGHRFYTETHLDVEGERISSISAVATKLSISYEGEEGRILRKVGLQPIFRSAIKKHGNYFVIAVDPSSFEELEQFIMEIENLPYVKSVDFDWPMSLGPINIWEESEP